MSNREVKDFDGSRRRGSVPKTGSVSGGRMKVDQVKAGTKVHNLTHEENSTNSGSGSMKNAGVEVDKKVNKMRPKQSPAGVSVKGKKWKSESSEGSPVKRSELSKKMDEGLCVSSDGIKKTSDVNAIKLRKVKSDFTEGLSDIKSEGSYALKKVKSETSKNLDGNLKNSLSVLLVKAKTEEERKFIDDEKVADESGEDLEGPAGVEKTRSDEDSKESGSDNVGQNQIMKESESNVDLVDSEEEEEDDKEMEVEVEKKIIDIKEVNMSVEEEKGKEIVAEEKKLIHSNEKPVPVSSIVKKQAVNHARIHPILTKEEPNDFHGNPSSQSKLQSFVDLVMWRDVSKSAFIFGIGSFSIISSSYTKDLNISFISVVSYLSLVYLAGNFLLKSLITRGAIDVEDTKQDYVVGEEEAVWVVKLVLPYVNEFLLKLRGLFSGDPATTLKLAVLLFILARCGGSITLWKMAKLGFFGVFTVPKVCSSYSSQLNAYGTFWIRRFGDAWESCSHKKAVGFGIFTLVWNMSSVVARIWAVFMLFVVFKYYQQFLFKEKSVQEQATIGNPNSQYVGRRQKNSGSTTIDIKKQKKVC